MTGFASRVEPPLGAHRKTAIWLHGMGEDASAYSELARRMDLPRKGVRGVFAQGSPRHRPLTGNAVPGWFDQDPGDELDAEPQSLNEAIDCVSHLLAQEAQLIDSRHIILCGFSQGAALALIAGLRFEQPLGGLMLYAPYMVRGARLRETRSAASVDTPVWIGHGANDTVVPPLFSERIKDLLKLGKYAVEYNSYEGGHKAFHGVDAGDMDRFFFTGRER
jgi:phospholipase/carboxylesterase